MNNKRITAKERGLLKGAVRRVFSRSDLRKAAIAAVKVDHVDPNRIRVKKWGRCPICTLLIPLYLMEVDHTIPIIPVDSTLENMSWDDVVNRTWCEQENLMAICKPCHLQKTKTERALRKKNKKT